MLFTLRVVDSTAAINTVTIEAVSHDVAVRQVVERGMRVLSVKSNSWQLPSRKRDGFALASFSQELLTLLNAGLALLESIETLSEKEVRPERKVVFERLVTELLRGISFSNALAQFPSAFPALFVATVRASERTGGLSEALEKYVTYQNQLDTVKKKLVSASIYPVLLMVVGTLVIGFLMGYVVPKFSKIFEDMGGEIPWMSRLLIEWGHFAQNYGMAFLIALGTALVALGVWLSQPATPALLLKTLQRIPTVGERVRVYQLARFYRSLGMLLRGGMPAVAAMELVAGLLSGGLHQSLARATRLIREGAAVSQSMESCGLTTSVSARMLRVGERTGQMGEMMERIAAFYDGEISQWIDWFIKLFEPLLMAFIGLVIGFIVVVMYFPIFELAGSIR